MTSRLATLVFALSIATTATALPGTNSSELLDYRSYLSSSLSRLPLKPKNPPLSVSSISSNNNNDAPNNKNNNNNNNNNATTRRAIAAMWMAPFFSGGGYCSEATAFVQGLEAVSEFDIAISQHGDGMNTKYMFGLSNPQYDFLQRAAAREIQGIVRGDEQEDEEEDEGEGGEDSGEAASSSSSSSTTKKSRRPPPVRMVSICHSEPGAWQMSRALPMKYPTSTCPTANAAYKIGRTMFESDRLPDGWNDRMQSMDEIWVPTAFMRDVAIQGGVDAEKLLVVPEPVDTTFFNPSRYLLTTTNTNENNNNNNNKQEDGEDMGLSIRIPPQFPVRQCYSAATATSSTTPPPTAVPKGSTPECPLRFLSIGKWERRKGFDILLRAYINAFADPIHKQGEHVELYILTSAYHSSEDFKQALEKTAAEITCGTGANSRAHNETKKTCVTKAQRELMLPTIKLVTNIPQADIAGVYAAVDALVQPSRGEGWGRPHVEGMAMGLPLIATYWSGPSEFMTEANSYPLRHVGMVPIPDGAFKGHLQAEPDAAHLVTLLRRIREKPIEAANKGKLARADMISLYEPIKVARFINAQMYRIERVVLHVAEEEVRARESIEQAYADLVERQRVELEESRISAEEQVNAAHERLEAMRNEAQQRIRDAIEEMERPIREAEEAQRLEEERIQQEEERQTLEQERLQREAEEAARVEREALAEEQQRKQRLQRERVKREAEEQEAVRIAAAKSDSDLDFDDLAAYATAPTATPAPAGSNSKATVTATVTRTATPTPTPTPTLTPTPTPTPTPVKNQPKGKAAKVTPATPVFTPPLAPTAAPPPSPPVVPFVVVETPVITQQEPPIIPPASAIEDDDVLVVAEEL